MGSVVTVEQPENPNESAAVKVAESNDGALVIEATTGGAFENKNAHTAALFGAFRPYHWAAIVCGVVGAVILGTGYLPNKWGIALIACGIGLAVLAHLLPAYGHLLPWFGGVAALGGVGYWLYEKGHYSPTPNDEEAIA